MESERPFYIRVFDDTWNNQMTLVEMVAGQLYEKTQYSETYNTWIDWEWTLCEHHIGN